MADVRIGVVGTGGMGKAHCRVIREAKRAVLVGVTDAVAASAEAAGEEFEATVYPSHEAMLDSGDVDAVTIATPHWFHPDVAVAAFDRKIHVLSEKPIAVRVSDADRMVEAWKASGAKFAVMFQSRTTPAMKIAHRLVEGGTIGEVYRTAMNIAHVRTQKYYESGDWRATWKGEGGGVLLNQAPHFLDYFTWIGGRPKSVVAYCDTFCHDIEVEDMASAILRYPNGGHGTIHTSTVEQPATNAMEFSGSLGKVTVDGGKVRLCLTSRDILEWIKDTDLAWGSVEGTWMDVNVPGAAPHGHGVVMQNFVDAILDGVPLVAPGEEGVVSLELANAMILSAKRGEEVALPLDRAEYDTLMDELCASSRYMG